MTTPRTRAPHSSAPRSEFRADRRPRTHAARTATLRVTRAVAATLIVALGASISAPASAQEGGDPPETTTTVPPETTTTVPTTTTTVPSTTTTPETTTVPGDTTTVPEDGPGIDPIDDTIAAPTEVPHGDLEVDNSPPPAGPWDNATTINPTLSNLVAKRSAAVERLDALRRAAADATAAASAATQAREQLEGDHSAAAARYSASTQRFRGRIAAMYISGGDIDIDLRPQLNVPAAADRAVVAGAISEADDAAVREHLAARTEIEGALADSIEAETTQVRGAELAAAAVADAEAALETADAELSATPAEINGFVFPIAGRTSFISSYGFCRAGCARSHQGNDLFAARGTPVVAVEDGWVERVSTNRLGGLVVWTRGRSGYRYYYAHLDSAADLTGGNEIVAGTVVGTVGDSGNARGTPPHLHFEIHPPGGGGAIDPYPILVGAPRVTLIDETTGEQFGPNTGADPDTA